MATMSPMQTAGGTCLIRTGLYACGMRVFSRDCQGWVAPPGVPVDELTMAKITDFNPAADARDSDQRRAESTSVRSVAFAEQVVEDPRCRSINRR